VRIETDRLVLVNASADLARALVSGDRTLVEGMLGAQLPARWPDEAATGILRRHLDLLESGGVRAAGFGVWIVTLPDARIAIGTAGFLGPPRDDGSIEMGYGIDVSFRGCGYATEAAGGLRDWVLRRPDVRSLRARSKRENAASIRVLEKIGMHRTGTADGMIAWTFDPALPHGR
jgi:[ribosomal protein S5]-alanine N-acetyltransferase